MEILVAAYSEPIILVGDMANWKIVEDFQTLQVNPPNVPSSSDHWKTWRITYVGEDILSLL